MQNCPAKHVIFRCITVLDLTHQNCWRKSLLETLVRWLTRVIASHHTCVHLQVFGYYASGSETEATLRDNRAVFSRYRLMPRMMVDVSNVDTTCTLLGMRHSTCTTCLPVLPALSLPGIGRPVVFEEASRWQAHVYLLLKSLRAELCRLPVRAADILAQIRYSMA